LRGSVGAAALWLVFESYNQLPVGDAYALLQTGVIWATLISWIWLNDTPHWTDFTSIPVTLAGVVFFAKPEFIFAGFGKSNLTGILAVLIGKVF